MKKVAENKKNEKVQAKKPTEIMTKKFNPRALAQEQYDAYKKYIVAKLDEVKEKILEEEYTEIEGLTARSPAGDGWGRDNNFIDFGFDKEPKDILEAANYLAFLRLYVAGCIPVDETYAGYDYINRDEYDEV